MEVRCGKCNKLFRVSDDKITGIGIKFPCTRCGDYVKITREDFQQYIVSQTAVSPLDAFEPKPSTASLPPEAAISADKETVPSAQELVKVEPAAPSVYEDAPNKEAPPLFAEPDHFTPGPDAKPEPAIELEPELTSMTESQAASAPEDEPRLEPVRPTASIAHPLAPPIQPAQSKKEPASPPAPSHTGRLFFFLVLTLIILILAGYGLFLYLQSSLNKGNEVVQEIVSNEGLQIENPVGSVEANGDLLITGVIENATEKERTDWYVVAEVYDTQGAILSKIRLLNGNQIYSPRDYDILVKRGVNVQELKTKSLHGKGVVLPPKGKVNFEARFLQPPSGIASFVVQALPFNREQLNRQIADEVK